jgi:2-dehydropantoate 2-reductase
LVVGAGCVGQVFGRALQRGGCELHFYVRERILESLRGGVVVYPLNSRRDRTGEPLQGYGLLSSPEQAAATAFDEVWLCVSSPALQGEWLGALAEATPGAVWVLLQPGIDDRALLLRHVPEARLVQGLIPFMSWMAPLPGEQVRVPGVMFYQPPLTPAPFSGPKEAVNTIVSTLRRGGQPARAAANVDLETALGSSLLLPIVGALELHGWSFSRLRGEGGTAAAATCARATVAIAARIHGQAPPPWLGLVRGPALWLATLIAPVALPLDLERFFERHFRKVGDQTRGSLQALVERGQGFGMEVGPIAAMVKSLGPAPK